MTFYPLYLKTDSDILCHCIFNFCTSYPHYSSLDHAKYIPVLMCLILHSVPLPPYFRTLTVPFCMSLTANELTAKLYANSNPGNDITPTTGAYALPPPI